VVLILLETWRWCIIIVCVSSRQSSTDAWHMPRRKHRRRRTASWHGDDRVSSDTSLCGMTTASVLDKPVSGHSCECRGRRQPSSELRLRPLPLLQKSKSRKSALAICYHESSSSPVTDLFGVIVGVEVKSLFDSSVRGTTAERFFPGRRQEQCSEDQIPPA